MALFAQQPEEEIERIYEAITMADEEGTDVYGEEILAHLQRLRRKPLNINSASREALLSLMLLTEFQVESILSAVASSGAILSYAELSLLYGFNEKIVEGLKPYIVLGEAGGKSQGFVKDQNTTLYGKYQITLPKESEQYIMRARFSYREKLLLSAIYKASSSKTSAQKLSTIGLSYSDINLGKVRIDKLVAGDFYARMGQGLCAWNGFSYHFNSETYGYVKNAETISVYTSSDTSKILRGIAATLSAGKFALSGGYSVKDKISVARLTYMAKRSRYGISYNGVGNLSNVFSIDILFTGRSLIGFAEVARSLARVKEDVVKEGFALLSGLSKEFGNYSLHLLLRSYQKDFYSPMGCAYSSISRIENQLGASLRMSGPIYGRTNFAVGADYTLYPAPRYHIKDPSCSAKAYIKFTLNDSSFGTQARNQLWVKGSVKYNLQYSSPVLREFSYDFKLGGTLSLSNSIAFVTRAELNAVEADRVGKALSVSLKGNMLKGGLVASVGAIYYDAQSWKSRIYFPQSDLPYSFTSTLLYGRGIDGWGQIKMRLSRGLSLYLKYQHNRGKNIIKGALLADL